MTNECSDFSNLPLETHAPIVRVIRVITVPLLNILPSWFIKTLMLITHYDAARVVKTSGSAEALEVMYIGHESIFKRDIISGLAGLFWHYCISQPKALRNRLRIVEWLIFEEIKRLKKDVDTIDIVSIGGGSMRAIIQAVSRLNGARSSVRIVNVDKDEHALILSKKIAAQHLVESKFLWVHSDTSAIARMKESHTHIVEIVGLLDYFSDTRVIKILTAARRILCDNGMVIIGNVMPNNEMPFVRKLGWPPMRYRTAEDIERILVEAGFKDYELFLDPLGVHCVAKAVKQNP